MFENCKKYGLLYLACFLLVTCIVIFYLDWQDSHRRLTFAMLNIGQGDGLFIESPTGTQILVDGGPPRKILGQLARVMSPFDKHIDGIIVTNPDQDHIGGLLDVLRVYKVGTVLEPGTYNDSKTFQNFQNEIKKQNISNILAKRGMRLDIGDGAVIDILFPDRDVFDWSPNDGSIVAKLTYGNTSIMLIGDATAKTEKIILDDFSKIALRSTILKVGHHGSRTSSSESFVRAISPEFALISNGKDNKYGHPHQDVLDTLASLGAKIFRTDLLGTIIIKSDGENAVFSFHR